MRVAGFTVGAIEVAEDVVLVGDVIYACVDYGEPFFDVGKVVYSEGEVIVVRGTVAHELGVIGVVVGAAGGEAVSHIDLRLQGVYPVLAYEAEVVIGNEGGGYFGLVVLVQAAGIYVAVRYPVVQVLDSLFIAPE